MPTQEEVFDIARETMHGDIRQLIINLFKDRRFQAKAWKDMKEDEQRQLVTMAEEEIEKSITRAVDIIASEGQPHVKVLLKQVAIKDNIKGLFECGKDHELRHDLADAAGNHVLVVLPNPTIYMGQRDRVKFDKDQPNLPATEPAKENEPNGETVTEAESIDPKTGEIKGGPKRAGKEQHQAQLPAPDPKIIDAEEVTEDSDDDAGEDDDFDEDFDDTEEDDIDLDDEEDETD